MFKTKSMVVVILAILFLNSFALSAKDKTDKEKDFQITGEAPEGGGYKLFFNKNKTSFLHLWGLARLYWAFDAENEKLSQRYFRFYLDGQKNDKWSFHARFDYQNAFHMSRKSTSEEIAAGEAHGAASIYFARAYVTYKFNDDLNIDMGRILNFHHKYDVLANVQYEVSHGAKINYKSGNFSLDFSAVYTDDSQAMSATGNNEVVMLGSRAGHQIIFSKDVKLTYGVAVGANYYEVTTGNRFYQILPDVLLNLPFDIYIMNQGLWLHTRGPKDDYQIENYLEVGKDITSDFAADVYLQTNKGKTDDFSVNDLGLEFVYKFSPSFTVVLSNELEDIGNKNKVAAHPTTDHPTSHTMYIEYMF